MNKRTKSNSIRIIAGLWRGRRLPVLDSEGLRPTTDRVRETLFNWLMHDIAGATCLDLFAGSGALGLECLSRGASYVDFVEADQAVARNIQQNVNLLLPEANNKDEDSRAKINKQDALSFIKTVKDKRYDIVFIDPPFQSNLAAQSIALLQEQGCLNDGAFVYLEQDSHHEPVQTPQPWELYREGKAGQSTYRLYIATAAE